MRNKKRKSNLTASFSAVYLIKKMGAKAKNEVPPVK